MLYPSKLVEDAVHHVSKLPGIGKKSALRLVLHLLKAEPRQTHDLVLSLQNLRDNIKYCADCHAISDHEICGICSSENRDKSTVCIVADTKDILAIENTSQYKGLYHVLGGIIDPVNGIGPSDLNIATLMSRIEHKQVAEVIVALNTTMEGDTTAFYLVKKLSGKNIKLSSIARGIPVGGELEYADEITLGRSILTRTSLSFDL